MIISEPWFYVTSVPTVLIYAIDKGGLGGVLSMISVPLTLTVLLITPIQAAAILLCVMDFFAVHRHYANADKHQIS